MGAMASQITSLTIVYSTVYSGSDKKKNKSPRHWPLCVELTGDRKMFPFDDVIMVWHQYAVVISLWWIKLSSVFHNKGILMAYEWVIKSSIWDNTWMKKRSGFSMPPQLRILHETDIDTKINFSDWQHGANEKKRSYTSVSYNPLRTYINRSRNTKWVLWIKTINALRPEQNGRPFCRRHLEKLFLKRKTPCFDWNLKSKVCS